MKASCPESLKKEILPFLQRAAELKQRDPIVAYYSLYYAAQLAIEKRQNEDARLFLAELLGDLESEKTVLKDRQEISNEVVGLAHVENFAMRIFNNADNEDRSSVATKKTAKTFLAASLFFEVLKVFGPLSEDVQLKIKYSKFKGVDIMKAINEGRVPTPGNPLDEHKTAGEDQKVGNSIDNQKINEIDHADQATPTQQTFQQTSQSDSQNPYIPRFQQETTIIDDQQLTESQFTNPYLPQQSIDSPQNPYIPQQSNIPSNPYLPQQSNNPASPYNSQQSTTSLNPYLPQQLNAPSNPYLPQQQSDSASQYHPMAGQPISSPANVNFQPSGYNNQVSNPYLPQNTQTFDNSQFSTHQPNLSTPSFADTNQYNSNIQDFIQPQQYVQQNVQQHQPTAPAPGVQTFHQPSAFVDQTSHVDPFSIDHKVIGNAQKAARHAISALQYEDVNNAVENLRKAISLLEPFLKK